LGRFVPQTSKRSCTVRENLDGDGKGKAAE
jgi:hypothetical protein